MLPARATMIAPTSAAGQAWLSFPLVALWFNVLPWFFFVYIFGLNMFKDPLNAMIFSPPLFEWIL